jgi:uncharacterized protein YbgA (DUF1722 family)
MHFDFKSSRALLHAIAHSSAGQQFDGAIIADITTCLDGFTSEQRRELRPLLHSARQAHEARTVMAKKAA